VQGDFANRAFMLTPFIAALVVGAALAQFGTIQIEWDAKGGSNGVVMEPRVVGVDHDDADTEPVSQGPEALYEEAWWRDGFAEDTRDTWFGASRLPRGPRPESLVDFDHRVGTVYRHTLTGSRGVIVGWDARTRAPRQWLDVNIPRERSWADRLRRLHAPHYSVLEERTAADGTTDYMQRYVVALCREEDPNPCLEVESPPSPLTHPDVYKFFDRFDSQQGYVPNASLRRLYPHG
jgi:hemimethylated DNA binding protein